MGDTKLSALTALTAPTADDLLYIVDAPGTTPVSKKVTVGNLFANVPANGLKVGTDQLVVTGGNVGIGIAAPDAHLHLYKEDTRDGSADRFLEYKKYLINPPNSTGHYAWYGSYLDVQQPATPTGNPYVVAGNYLYMANIQGSAAIYGYDVMIDLFHNSTLVRGLTFSAVNQATAGTLYASQLDSYNSSMFGRQGQVSTMVGQRIKMINTAQNTGLGHAIAGTVVGIHLEVDNIGGTINKGQITLGIGIQIDTANDANSTVVTSYGMLINAPVSPTPGAITNRYGLYMGSQAVPGATVSYAIYIDGGESHFGGALEIPEMAAPTAKANCVKLFAQDNGGGKTQLMALFPTGVAQQIAIEA